MKYLVERNTDAWVIHSVTIEADSPEEAMQKAKEHEDSLEWNYEGYTEFQETKFEVYSTDNGPGPVLTEFQ